MNRDILSLIADDVLEECAGDARLSIPIAAGEMVEEGAKPAEIRDAILNSSYADDPQLNIRATLELFGQ